MSISNDLRQAVLQAAIQGKLTKQLPEDGNAKDLLEQIKADKAKLVKEGKLKKEKPLPEITEDEKPFDIPDNWEWVRLNDVSFVTKLAGFEYTKHMADAISTIGEVPVVRAKNIKPNCFIENTSEFITLELSKQLERCALDTRCVLMTFIGAGIGEVAIFENKRRNHLAPNVAKIVPFIDINDYLLWYLCSENGKCETFKFMKQTAQPSLSMQTIRQILVPLPPLSEQKRIVAKVEELMAKIDELEKTEKELEALKKDFPADMKDSLLQAAMQGKLTEQLPEDGNAKDLLEQIKAEKAKLLKEGKLKKEKPLPEITEDEKPFDIPENWEWARLGEVARWGSGSTPSKSNPDYYGGDIPWLLTGDLNNDYINSVDGRITELALKETSVKLNPVGSVLIAMYGATIGKLGILNIEATTNQACCAGVPHNGIYNKFLFYFLMAHKPEFVKRGEGGAQPNISREKIIVTLMPIPPLAEQKRIVEKLEKLLPLCDGLEG